MRVTRIQAKNLLAHEKLDLELTKTISIFVARNGEGKSTILDVPKIVLTGSARGVPRKDTEELACWWGPSTRWSAEIVLEHGGSSAILRRTRTKLYAIDDEGVRHDLNQKLIEGKLASTKTLEAVFDLWRALEMSPDELRSLIFDLVGIEVDGDYCRENGIEDTEIVEAIIGGRWKKAEGLAAEKKRAYNRQLGESAAEAPEDPDVGGGTRASEVVPSVLADSKATLKKLEKERDILNRRLGAATAPVVNRRAELRLELDGYNLDRLRARKKDLEETIRVASEVVDGLSLTKEERGVEAAKKLRSDSQDALEGAKASRGGGHTCRVCGLVHDWENPATSDDIVRLEDADVGAYRTVSEAVELLGQGRAFLKGKADEAKEARGELALVDDELSRGEVLEGEWNRLKGVDITAREDPKEVEKALGVVEVRLRKGRGIVGKVQEFRRKEDRFNRSRKERVVLERKAKEFADIEAKCRPSGLPAKLLEETRGTVLERLHATSELLFRADNRIAAVTLDENFEPLLCLTGGETRSLRTLNPGARWKVGLALADSLAQLSGLRFLALDEVTLLDVETRIELLEALVKLVDDYDQILLAAVLGDVEPVQAPEVLPMMIYIFSDGRVSPA